jgi:hypothetical protein
MQNRQKAFDITPPRDVNTVILHLLFFVVRSDNNRKIGYRKNRVQKRILPVQYPSKQRY